MTDDEKATITEHPIYAAQEILKPISHVFKHNTDYRTPPRKLGRHRISEQEKGDDIPLISQIILIVDSYYAMTSDRPYRKAYSEAEAVNEIKKSRGKKYSEELTDEFVHAIEDLKRM